MRLLLALALCAHAAPRRAPRAARPEPPLQALERLVREQENKPANEIHDLDRKIAGLRPQLSGVAAAEPLRALAADASKPLKARVWAVNFLGLLDDPGAFLPLSSLALSREQPDAVREAALSSLESTGVGPAALRGTACAALAQEDLPEASLGAAARLASRVGCDDPAILSRRAKQSGSSPKGEPGAQLAALSIAGLSRSHPVEAAHQLWALFDFFKQGTPQRGLVLVALQGQLDNVKSFREMTTTKACEALVAESGAPENAVCALRLLQAVDGRACEKTLLRELSNGDAEVLAQTSEALADFKLVSARKPLAKLIEGAIKDPRFAPANGRPDPTEQLARIQRAYNRLRN